MKALIAWFARNGVAANLLVILVIAGGLLTLPGLKQEVFPELSSNFITVSVNYLGAAPEEVEEGVCVRIEEAVQGLDGVKRITSAAVEGSGMVFIEAHPESDLRKLLDEVKARVDAIDAFPEQTERPVVQELLLRRQVINVAVSGDTDELSLRRAAERVRDELAGQPGITLVELANARPYEISIEVSEEALKRHDLSFQEVADAIRRSSLDLPGGSLKTAGGEILLRTKGQAYSGRDFEELTLLRRADGTRLRLADVAVVVDGFADTDQFTRFDGKPAILVQVFRVGPQGALEVAESVRRYVERARHLLPEGIEITTWQDDSAVLRSRVDLLVRNGRAGLVLVFLSLALFLRLRISLWVAFGIPVAFLGAIWLMPALDLSINLISLFAFIVVLGIVVDDAIVVGENVYTKMQQGKPGLQAAIEGAQEVSLPVTFAVLTTVAAFMPLLTVPGNMGQVMRVIPAIVIATLAFSLIESLLVLPSHLSHIKVETGKTARGPIAWWERVQALFGAMLGFVIERLYRPTLSFCLSRRYLSLSLALSVLLVSGGLIAGGHLKFVFFPPVDADNVVASLTMPQGATTEVTSRALERLEQAALALEEELIAKHGEKEGRVYRHILSSIGGHPYKENQNLNRGRSVTFAGAHLGEVNIELRPSEERSISSTEIARRWRELTGSIPDAVEMAFTSSIFSTGEAINIQLASRNIEELRAAAAALKERLEEYAGVTEIADSYRLGKQEVKLRVKPEAEHLGVSLADVAQQVRQGFYGEEAQRLQRGRDDVRVMVRYPAAERRSLSSLESMYIRLAGGVEVPFVQVAEASLGQGYSVIQRAGRRRVINVTAEIDHNLTNANEVLSDLQRTALPQLLAGHPGLAYTLEGEQREQRETLGGLGRGFGIAILMIYALLAIPFKSYVQPAIVMSAIPFGIIGAIWGHVLMGMDLTLLSVFGLVALTGVVVNDSLVMVDFINRAYRGGLPLVDAVRQSGAARFRPILLTSLTTFAGLTPLLLERSLQARFLVPMAISLGFGVLFATLVTLLLVPMGYMILEDLKRLAGRLLARGSSEQPAHVARHV
jgi:multidrug efflux pump subunit AcrB